MYKKMIAITLIVILIICNAMVAVGAETFRTDVVGNELVSGVVAKEQEVTASFEVSENKIYSVTIEWGALKYIPTEQLIGQWANGYYKIINENVQWKEEYEGAGSVKITNNSSVAMGARLFGTIDENFKNNYFITDEKKQSALFTFEKSLSEEHTAIDSWVFKYDQAMVYATLDTPSRGQIDTCSITDIGVVAPIEKVDNLLNDNKKIGKITVELVEIL